MTQMASSPAPATDRPSRFLVGTVLFANSPDEVAAGAEKLLALRFGNFPVTEVLIEEAIDIAHEIFVSMSIDDAARAPVLLLDFHGGSGIEERAATVIRLPVDPATGIREEVVRSALAAGGPRIAQDMHALLAQTIAQLVALNAH